MQKWFTLLLILALHAGVFSQTIAHRVFDQPDQFGSDISWTLYKDNRGFIWAGPTGMGAVAYDGKNFMRFTEEDGLPGNFVISFLHDSQDRMWFGCQGKGLAIYDGKKYVTVAEEDSVGLTSNNILCMHETASGLIYLSTFGGGIMRYDDGYFMAIDTTHGGLTVYDMEEDPSGKILWLATRLEGLAKLENDTITLVEKESGIPAGQILDLELMQDGSLLVCHSKGLYRYREGSPAMRFDESIGLPAGYQARYCTESRDGKIYLSTNQGFYVIEKDQASPLNMHDNFVNVGTKMLEDNAGHIWASTNGSGIVQLIPNGFELLSTPDKFVFSTNQDRYGDIYVGSENGIYRYRNANLRDVKKVVNIEQTHMGMSWFIVLDTNHFIFTLKGQGLYECKGSPDNVTQLKTWEIIHDQVLLDGDRLLSIGTTGFVEYSLQQRGEARRINLPGPQIVYFSLCHDKDKNVWLGGYDDGLILRMNERDTTIFSTDHGLPKGAILSLLEAPDGKIWYLNIDGYYGYYTGTGFTKFPPVTTGEVQAFVVDRSGDIWFSGRYGIAFADLENDRVVSTRLYSIGDGVSTDMTAGCQGQLLADGRILIPKTDNKAYLIDPAKINPIEEKPSIYISAIEGRDGILLDSLWYKKSGGFFNLPEDIVLPYAENNLTVKMGSVFFSYPNSLLYTYQLIGYDDTWSNPKPEGEINFTNLPAGDYELQIKAIAPGKLESEIISITFSIETPWFQSWVFYIACIVSGGLLIWLIFRWRLSRIRKEKERLEAVVAERTREVIHEKEIVEEKNKAILDSINYAKRLQNAILPSAEKLQNGLRDYFLMYQPKDIVSGDFYWFEEYDELLYIAVADCTGHGVPGAMVSTVCANALNKSLHELNKKTPAEILDSTRELVISHFSKGSDAVNDGMDITLVCFNRKTLQLEFAGANNHLWIASSDKADDLIQLAADKQPVGKFAHASPFTNTRHQLKAGDVLYLSSDGYQDQFGGEKGKKLKAANMKKILFENHGLAMDQQMQKLESYFKFWKSDFEQVDDVCVMGVRV